MRVCILLAFAFFFFSAVAVAQSPMLLVLEKDDHMLALVDPASQKVIGRVPAGEDPHEVVTDGHFAYISNYGAFASPQHTITVVDIAARKVATVVDLGSLIAPHGLQMADGMVYFTAEGSKAIGRYNPSTKKIDWTLGLGQNRSHMLVVRGDQIFTSNVNSDSISILDHDKKADVSGWTQTTVAVGKGPEGFDVSPDGKELWAANSHDGTVSVIDVASKQVKQTLQVGTKMTNRLKFTLDGKFVLMSDLRGGDLVVIDAVTRKEVKRLNLGKGAAGILIAPDGSHAYVAVSPDNNVVLVDLRSFTITGRIATGKGPDGMAWAAQP